MIYRSATTGGETAPVTSWPRVTIVGTIAAGISGAVSDATVTFSLPTDITIRDSADNEVRIPQTQTFTAAQIATGVRVPATDDSSATPSTWHYLLTESWPGGRVNAEVTLPAATPIVHYSDL